MDEFNKSRITIQRAINSLVYKNCNNLFYNDYLYSHPLFTKHMEVFFMEVEGVGKVAAGYRKTEVPVVEQEAVHVSQPKEVAASESKVLEKQDQEQKQNKERVVSEASINDAVSKANRNMDKVRCEYSYHKETNRVSIRVIDEATKEVIREIPPEKSLDMLQKMWEMAGILVDEKR